MKFQYVDWYSWFIVVLVIGFLVLLLGICQSDCGLNVYLPVFFVNGNSCFVFDYVGLCLGLLSVLLSFVLVFVSKYLFVNSMFYILVSIVSSIICYFSNNVFFFWWFYEVSIISLLFLIILDSPYSERFIAGWYLVGYVVLTSLPMVLCLVYLSVLTGSLMLSDWGLYLNNMSDGLEINVLVLLGVLFVTKIPLPPFHVWLPIVHAEATSLVSICLSGYVMKLGLLGVCRFCWWCLPVFLFSDVYVLVSLFLSLVFFLCASMELDGKRWLAFLSLSHIVICMICMSVCSYLNLGLLFIFSVGHGLSAGLVFVMLWFFSDLCGSRNWFVLKSVFGSSLLYRVLVVFGLCTVASFPPVVQFFVEVSVFFDVCGKSFFLFLLFCSYIFMSSLVPLLLLGSLLNRCYCVGLIVKNGNVCFYIVSLFLVVWCFMLFVVF